MSNRVKLDDLPNMTVSGIAELPVDQLAMLAEDLDAMADTLDSYKSLLGAALGARYGELAAAARRVDGKESGTVRLDDGEFTVKADLPKRVEWDQAKLAAIETTLRDTWKEDPAEYIKVKREVSERAYGAWPSVIRKMFEPARTVKPGKPTFELIKRQAEAA